jgi:hypothetical protein
MRETQSLSDYLHHQDLPSFSFWPPWPWKVPKKGYARFWVLAIAHVVAERLILLVS